MKILGFLSLLILFSVNLSAQKHDLEEETFEAYAEYLLKEFGIICNIPPGFTNSDYYNAGLKVRKDKDKPTGNFFGLAILSDNKECMVMYSGFPRFFTTQYTESEKNQRRNVYPGSQITAEIKTALGLYYFPNHPLNNDTAEFSFNDYVTIISGKKAGKMFNADSVYIYDIPGADSVYFLKESLENIRKSSYPYCTGMFIRDRKSVV